MLRIETSKGNKVDMVILDTPTMRRVSGICQCRDCGATIVLTNEDEDDLAEEIITFADRHPCGRLHTREELLNAILKEKKAQIEVYNE